MCTMNIIKYILSISYCIGQHCFWTEGYSDYCDKNVVLRSFGKSKNEFAVSTVLLFLVLICFHYHTHFNLN